jgi:hypothetical protein
MAFKLENIDYEYLWYSPQVGAKYGLAITFWYSNLKELIFFLQYIDKSWLNRDKIDISICSRAELTEEQLNICKPLCNYIVRSIQRVGKEDGTTSHLNGAMYPLVTNDNLVTATHVDSDEIIINHAYFFGYANMLLDSGKVVLNTQQTFLYNMEGLDTYEIKYPEDWTQRLNHFLILNLARARKYIPVKMNGNFHKDLWAHFVACGFTHDDLFLLKRVVSCSDIQPNMLYGFNFHLGTVHECNTCEWPENEDRKVRLLRLMSVPIWDGMPEGFHWHVNPSSPVTGYKVVKEPPYNGYEAKLYKLRENK